MSKILLQIDSCLGVGSTGRITESIARVAQSQGWECYIVHGGRYVKRPSCMTDIQAVSVVGEYLHFVESLLLDNHGLASRGATKHVVEIIKRIKPDVIQLHCVHGYYLNYKSLFEYLNTTDIPIVWTFHDCWAFTGHCAHFVTVGCVKWKTGCFDCPLKSDYPKSLIDRSHRNYEVKKRLFTANKNTYLVPVSDWLASLTGQSFFKGKDIRVIKNGVDLNVFKPTSILRRGNRILGVSGVWTEDKGMYDFFKLRELLEREKYEIVLVGLCSEQVKSLPKGIVGIEHTESVQELAELYSSASVFVNPTYADTYPTVNLEALACGTPVVTYRTGGSPEAIDEKTGLVVEQGDVNALAAAIEDICSRDRAQLSTDCRARAEQLFDKNKCFEKYVELYEELIEK